MGAANCKDESPETDSKYDFQNSKSNGVVSHQPDEDYVEGFICNESDINENEMKQFELANYGKVLLVKQNGNFSAIGTKCSHYGALLSTGVLGEGRIRCPWHGACFSITTGDIEDYPAEDSIPCYKVTVIDGKVKVRAKRTELETNKRTKPMVRKSLNDRRTFVVIGGGPSGAICVETLRQEGFTGRIVLVCKEPYLPYDRVKVSKSIDFDIKKAELRSQEFYNNNNIETLLGIAATDLDTKTREVHLSNNEKIKFNKVYIATGSNPRKLDVPGADLKNVITLRDYDEAVLVSNQIDSTKHVVVLGLSFTALEAAAYCLNKVAKVTVIGRDSIPFRPVFGQEIGQRVLDMFKEKGIEFYTSNGIKKCLGADGVLTDVELHDGTMLKADICIMAVGATFYTSFLQNSDVQLNKDGSIETDVYLQTNIRNIYAGGDIANAPVFSMNQRKATIGHYPLAQYHGKIAALNMVSKRTSLAAVPYFWTVLFAKSFRYAGHGPSNNCQIMGSLENFKFYAFYYDTKDKVVAMSSCGFDPIVSQFAEYLAQGRELYKSNVEVDPLAWIKELNV